MIVCEMFCDIDSLCRSHDNSSKGLSFSILPFPGRRYVSFCLSIVTGENRSPKRCMNQDEDQNQNSTYTVLHTRVQRFDNPGVRRFWKNTISGLRRRPDSSIQRTLHFVMMVERVRFLETLFSPTTFLILHRNSLWLENPTVVASFNSASISTSSSTKSSKVSPEAHVTPSPFPLLISRHLFNTQTRDALK